MKKNYRFLMLFTLLGLASISSSYATEGKLEQSIAQEQKQTSTPEVKNSKKTRQPKQTAKVVKQVDKRVEEACQALQNLFPDLTVLHPALGREVAKARNPHAFTDESLAKLVTSILESPARLSQEQMYGLQTIELTLQEKLQEYTITGFSWAIDPNLAIFLNHQNPSFNVTYKNAKGEIKYKNFDSVIKSIGFKLEASIKFDLILFVNTDLNFYDSSEPIALGNGIDISFSYPELARAAYLFDFFANRRGNGPDFVKGYFNAVSFWKSFLKCAVTYVSFENIPGGLLIFSIPIISLMFGNQLGLVYGGQLMPTN